MFAIPAFVDARIEVLNRGSVPVTVSAEWSGGRRHLGTLGPEAGTDFRIDGESAVRFLVVYPDGRQVTSDTLYYAEGLCVRAIVRDAGVRADHDCDVLW